MTTAPPVTEALLRSSVQAARESKRNLDATALGIVATLVGTTGLLWFLRLLPIDLGPALWASFVYAALYLLVSALTDRLDEARSLSRASQALQISLVPYLALFWHLVGGVANPVFLLAFFLPVATTGATLSRTLPYVAAALAGVTVVLVAAGESAPLRWQAGHAWPGLESIGILLSERLPTRVSPFPQIEPESGFLVVLLIGFVVLLFASAVVAQSVAHLVLRLAARLRASSEQLAEVTDLFQSILRAEPEPGVVVYADTGQIVQVSDSFLKRMLLDPEQVVGRTLFDLVEFSQPERIRTLLQSGRGEAPFCAYRIGPEVRIANVSLHSVLQGSTPFAYVGFKDLTESYYLHAAFDAIPDPLLVVGHDAKLRYANRAAEDAFGALHFNMDVSELLTAPELPPDWWRQMDAEESRRLEVGDRPYRATALAAPLPDESGSTTILTLRDVTREEELVHQANVDPLTGAYNRRYLELTLLRRVALVARGGKATLAVFDLDDFKSINERFGHAGGDEAVRYFTRSVRAELRASDVVARIGGDEFAVLFPDIEPHEASIVIDRMRHRMERAPFAFAGTVRPLSFSAGAAAMRADDSIDSLSRRADHLLAAAKLSGKNRCHIEL